MTVPKADQDYVQVLDDFLKDLRTSDREVMELSPSSSPILTAEAPAVDYKLRRANSDPEQIMFLRVNFTSYQTVNNRHELTSITKTHIQQACDAFCRGEGVRFNV